MVCTTTNIFISVVKDHRCVLGGNVVVSDATGSGPIPGRVSFLVEEGKRILIIGATERNKLLLKIWKTVQTPDRYNRHVASVSGTEFLTIGVARSTFKPVWKNITALSYGAGHSALRLLVICCLCPAACRDSEDRRSAICDNRKLKYFNFTLFFVGQIDSTVLQSCKSVDII